MLDPDPKGPARPILGPLQVSGGQGGVSVSPVRPEGLIETHPS